MEIKAILNSPYSEEQRLEFIIENNHNLGYEIRGEEPEDLIAWGLTEEEKKEQEQERISHLCMTKRVCALMLQELGVPYSQLKEAIATSEQAQLEWDLCVELERCNPLIDVIGKKFGLSPEQIDQMFKYANGEVDTLEVSNE